MDGTAMTAVAGKTADARVSMPNVPLAFLKPGDSAKVVKLKADEKLHHHLENLGFVEGSQISVVAENGGNLIVEVKGAQFGIDKSMARRIIVR